MIASPLPLPCTSCGMAATAKRTRSERSLVEVFVRHHGHHNSPMLTNLGRRTKGGSRNKPGEFREF